MKIAITKEVPLSQVFGHALAAWDWTVYEWYRGVRYSQKGDALAFDRDPVPRIKVRVTPNKLRKALELCLRKGGNYATEAMRIIDDSPACDMNTADTLIQVLAYGECVYG